MIVIADSNIFYSALIAPNGEIANRNIAHKLAKAKNLDLPFKNAI